MEALNQSENNSTEEEEVIDPITIPVNARASLSASETQRGSVKTTNVSTWDRLKENPNQHFAMVKGKLRGNCSQLLALFEHHFEILSTF